MMLYVWCWYWYTCHHIIIAVELMTISSSFHNELVCSACLGWGGVEHWTLGLYGAFPICLVTLVLLRVLRKTDNMLSTNFPKRFPTLIFKYGKKCNRLLLLIRNYASLREGHYCRRRLHGAKLQHAICCHDGGADSQFSNALRTTRVITSRLGVSPRFRLPLD